MIRLFHPEPVDLDVTPPNLRGGPHGDAAQGFFAVGLAVAEWLSASTRQLVDSPHPWPVVGLDCFVSYGISINAPRISIRIVVPKSATPADIETFRVSVVNGLRVALAPICGLTPQKLAA